MTHTDPLHTVPDVSLGSALRAFDAARAELDAIAGRVTVAKAALTESLRSAERAATIYASVTDAAGEAALKAFVDKPYGLNLECA